MKRGLTMGKNSEEEIRRYALKPFCRNGKGKEKNFRVNHEFFFDNFLPRKMTGIFFTRFFSVAQIKIWR